MLVTVLISHLHRYMRAYVYVYVCKYVCTYACIHICMYNCICMYDIVCICTFYGHLITSCAHTHVCMIVWCNIMGGDLAQSLGGLKKFRGPIYFRMTF